MSAHARNPVIQQLRQRLRQMEGARPPADQANATASTGVAALDALVVPEVFRPGMIIEWVVERTGSGAARLALPAATHALQHGGALVVIDDRREFYPPAAARLGVDLERTIVVRPRDRQETVWALEQALRCSGVAATLGWIDRLDDRTFRRLQLAAEQGGGRGLFLRPIAARKEPTWADLRWLVQPVPGSPLKRALKKGDRHRATSEFVGDSGVSPGASPRQAVTSSGRRLRVELLHCREGTPGRAVQLEIDDETGAVRVVPAVAAAKDVPRSARA